jgi:G3E family GTPase
MKHILEAKHNKGEEFKSTWKCAVIVNDMAELNIDKNLIDQSAVLHSDEVIAMDNGCVCCTLSSDLVDQIIKLASQNTFDYMIIEASGVSEPSHIAQLFADCKDDHDHDEAHANVGLGDVARLDTCVTVVDAAEFFRNLETVIRGPQDENFPELMIEQLVHANVILLNKKDLVNESQRAQICDQITVLNPDAKIFTCQNSAIDIAKVLNTNLFDVKSLDPDQEKVIEPEEVPACCQRSIANGRPSCCRRSRTHTSDKSQVILASTQGAVTRHQSRFGITSFLYKARRPFHPERFGDLYADKFFVSVERKVETDEKKREASIIERQEKAMAVQRIRTDTIGQLLRSKGFIWMPNTHDLMGVVSQAGNMITIDSPGTWLALEAEAWKGSDEVKAQLRKDWLPPYNDRRQDLVFIGQNLNHLKIQEILDECLLTDEEFAMGPDGWKATFGDLFLDDDPEDEQLEGTLEVEPADDPTVNE